MQACVVTVGVICLLFNSVAAARQLQRAPKTPVWPDTYQVLCLRAPRCNTVCMCMLHCTTHALHGVLPGTTPVQDAIVAASLTDESTPDQRKHNLYSAAMQMSFDFSLPYVKEYQSQGGHACRPMCTFKLKWWWPGRSRVAGYHL
jgi:hypothetical protein